MHSTRYTQRQNLTLAPRIEARRTSRGGAYIRRNSEKVFYLYHLGRYYNKSLYHYGESLHPEVVEFNLITNLPYCKKVIQVPVEHRLDGKTQFDEYIKINNLKASLPLKYNNEEMDDVICTSDMCDLDKLIAFIENIFVSHENSAKTS